MEQIQKSSIIGPKKNPKESAINLGARVVKDGVYFRVWAPKCHKVEIISDGRIFDCLTRDSKGYFSGFVANIGDGFLYKFRLDGKNSYPDPCSRFQPQGPHGPSMVISSSFPWTDNVWQGEGLKLHGQVFYELHVGTFSVEGDFLGIINELKELKALGVTTIELMPISDFAGRWNWGYDGVNLFAPSHNYGSPQELKRLIDYAHRLNMGVILDVVYNHLGPDGNYLKGFSESYFTNRYETDWGEAINFDGEDAQEVREFFIQNAEYWLSEFHFDGLRLDATQNICDKSPLHILAEISKTVRERVFPKKIILIAENESQDIKLIAPLEENGYGLDGIWNDDFHHTSKVAMTGRREAYYTDYLGSAQEFVSMVKRGFLYQGQFYTWQDNVRGTHVPKNIPAESFILYLQNHDQVANSLYGQRITNQADISLYRALTSLWLLAPGTPLIFMGQEFGASSPFLFFTDHHKELAPLVFKGRKEFLSQFPSIAAATDVIGDPNDEKAYRASKLNFEERFRNKPIYDLHKDLLKLRRELSIFNEQDCDSMELAILTEKVFVIRYEEQTRVFLLLINLGDDFKYSPCPEPLLAQRPQRPWELVWSSEDVKYGGKGAISAFTGRCWYVPARCAQILMS
jgi:maltooligosyltrehalose trehalohydrolase